MPTWTDDRSGLAYVSLEASTATLWLLDLESGRSELAGPASAVAVACPREAPYFAQGQAAKAPPGLFDDRWATDSTKACKAAVLAAAHVAEVAMARRRLGISASALEPMPPSPKWSEHVAAVIRRNVIFDTSTLQDNPAVWIDLTLAADGTVMSAEVSRPSGNPAWDTAAWQGVMRTAKLPLDVGGRVPRRVGLAMRPLQ